MLETVRLAVKLAVYMIMTSRQNTHQAAATILPEIQVGLPLSGPCCRAWSYRIVNFWILDFSNFGGYWMIVLAENCWISYGWQWMLMLKIRASKSFNNNLRKHEKYEWETECPPGRMKKLWTRRSSWKRIYSYLPHWPDCPLLGHSISRNIQTDSTYCRENLVLLTDWRRGDVLLNALQTNIVKMMAIMYLFKLYANL